jgi:hypothetical protein
MRNYAKESIVIYHFPRYFCVWFFIGYWILKRGLISIMALFLLYQGNSFNPRKIMAAFLAPTSFAMASSGTSFSLVTVHF